MLVTRICLVTIDWAPYGAAQFYRTNVVGACHHAIGRFGRIYLVVGGIEPPALPFQVSAHQTLLIQPLLKRFPLHVSLGRFCVAVTV